MSTVNGWQGHDSGRFQQGGRDDVFSQGEAGGRGGGLHEGGLSAGGDGRKHGLPGTVPQRADLDKFDTAFSQAIEGLPLNRNAKNPSADEDHPDALSVELALPRAVRIPMGAAETSFAQAASKLSSERVDEVLKLADRVSSEIGSLSRQAPQALKGGAGLRLELAQRLGSGPMGLEAITLRSVDGALVVSLTPNAQGPAHDLALAMQALAAQLSRHHPTRTVRVEEEPRGGNEPEALPSSPFSLRPASPT